MPPSIGQEGIDSLFGQLDLKDRWRGILIGIEEKKSRISYHSSYEAMARETTTDKMYL